MHAARNEEGDAEARLDEALLRGEAVDPDDLARLDARRVESLLENGGERLAPAARWGKGHPPLAREEARLADPSAGQAMVRGRGNHQRLLHDDL